METTLEEIGERLEAQGLGVLGETIFAGDEPASPAELIAVLATSGLSSVRAMQNPDAVKRPSFQIVGRSVTLVGARTLADGARAALNDFAGTLSGGGQSARYLDIQALNPEAFPLKRKTTTGGPTLHRWACNFQAHKEPST